jgi:hypothetical protein
MDPTHLEPASGSLQILLVVHGHVPSSVIVDDLHVVGVPDGTESVLRPTS